MPIDARMRRRLWPRELGFGDFSGGLNLRDAPTELANNESPDLWNVTLDERGGVQKRLGHAKKNPVAYATTYPPQNEFEWKHGAAVFTQCGPDIFKDDTVASMHTFSTAARCGFVEFASSVYAIHPVDGLYASTDGITWTHVTGSPAGATLAVWQTRMLAGGDPAQPLRLYACAINDPSDWTTGVGHGWTNDIREGNDTGIVALSGASGVDISGRPGLLVFKKRSCHRVYDADTGAYTTLDPAVGAASANSVVDTLDRTVALSERGIFWTDGNGPMQQVSQKIQPLFDPARIALDQLDLWCAGAKGDRVHFSLPLAGSTHNDLHLEYHPAQGWIVAGSDAASCYATYTAGTEKLYGGSPTVAGQVYEMGVGGTDDGAEIACRYQTKWIAPSGGIECSFRRLRVFGRGVFDLYTKLNFDIGDGDLTPISLPGGALVWDDGLWDVGEWGPANYEDSGDFWSLGKGTHISFVFKETSGVTASASPLLGVGAAPEVGAFAVYGLNLQFIPIGV